jgi:hypothetical protein
VKVPWPKDSDHALVFFPRDFISYKLEATPVRLLSPCLEGTWGNEVECSLVAAFFGWVGEFNGITHQ